MRLKATEHEEQAAFVDWLRWNKIPAFAIPNGAMLGGRNKYALLNKLKAEGLEPGVPDVFIARSGNYPSIGGMIHGAFHGLFIEMKSETGKVSEDQAKWYRILTVEGYAVSLARSADEAKRITRKYLGMKEEG